MNIQKNIGNKKYWMVSTLVCVAAVALPSIVSSMFAWTDSVNQISEPVIVALAEEESINGMQDVWFDGADEFTTVEEDDLLLEIEALNEANRIDEDTGIDSEAYLEEDVIVDVDIYSAEINEFNEIEEEIELAAAEEMIDEEEILPVLADLYSEEVLIETLTWALAWDYWFEEENNITIHLWVDDGETLIFGHWDAWKEITLISQFGFTCGTYIDSNKAYRCSLWEFQEIILEDIRVKYVEEDIYWDMFMDDPMMMGEF